MADNFPGPQVIDIQYTFSAQTHHALLNCELTTSPIPGQDLGDFNVKTRGGTTPALATAVANWITLIRPIFGTTAQFESWTLWDYVPNSFDRTFINSAVVDLAGTSGSANVASAQLIMTFRTAEGGTMKLAFMENISVPGPTISRATATGAVLAIFQFVEGATNWILGRDTSYPIVGINSLPGQNEALFKRRNRNL